MANKYRAEVPADEFGPGYTIRLDMAGHGKLESEGGSNLEQIGQAIYEIPTGLALVSAQYVERFLRVALRNADGELIAVNGFDIQPDVPLGDIAKKCLDSFCLFRYGKDSETWAAETQKKPPEKAAAPNP